MRWQMGRRSTNVEDRRGMSGRGIAGIGGIGGIIVIALIALLTGTNPLELLQGISPTTEMVDPSISQGDFSAQEQERADFASVILADTEDTWRMLFEQELGSTYVEPKLVLFSGAVQSACGFAQAAVGPFYCPGDDKVYLDLGFFDELSQRLGAPGDFAQAYVIAHEIGHHVQNLTGIMEQVHAAQQRANERQANELSVRLELQADFLAGVWAHHAQRARQILEEGDIEEGLNAASQIGDDRLQMETQGYVVPDAFTHGTAEQRARWFLRGYQTGDLQQGDTFSASSL
ncbi:MAG: zinc metallopeptidase [Candidatus Eisenbacteria bacterium]|nr:zinc metallopeptidase [Candidatus Eisenbacteria bacterium]